MAQPRTEIVMEVTSNESYFVVAGSMQGWRETMEDRHVVLLGTPADSSCMFFAVYDGHGGPEVADYAAHHLHERVTQHRSYLEGDIEAALEQGFLQIDRELRNDHLFFRTGSTALVVLIRGTSLYAANLGDCRGIAGVQSDIVYLSRDHKPSILIENARILRTGFTVEGDRIDGHLNVSRSLGDFHFKMNPNFPPTEQAVISVPEVRTEFVTHDWSWIFLGSDGIWDVMPSEDLGAFIRANIRNNVTPEQIIQNLLNYCLAPNEDVAGNDNMTALLVVFLKNSSREYRTIMKTQYLRQLSPQPHSSKLREKYPRPHARKLRQKSPQPHSSKVRKKSPQKHSNKVRQKSPQQQKKTI